MSSSAPRPAWYALGFLALGALLADQFSKYAIDKLSPAGATHVVIPGLLNLVHTDNPGVAFGLFADSGKPWLATILIAFSAGVIALLAWLLASGRAGGRLAQCGLALILGGAVGNVFDRVLRKSVTDFIDFYVGSHHWYTFNVADAAIVVGAGLVILELIRDWRHPTHEQA